MSYLTISEARNAFAQRLSGLAGCDALARVVTWHNVYVLPSPRGKAAVATYGMACIKWRHAKDSATKSLLSYRIRVIPKQPA